MFHNVDFPLSIAFGSRGGPVWRTDISRMTSGREVRNSPLSRSYRRYDVGAGITSLADAQTLIAFFEARRGPLHGFRFRDPLDHSTAAPGQEVSGSDVTLGLSNGTDTAFALFKTYPDAQEPHERPITLPRVGSMEIAGNGAPIDPGDYDLSSQPGFVVFHTAPPSGVYLTAGFEFDVPVRFASDQLDVRLETYGAAEAVNIPLVEISHA